MKLIEDLEGAQDSKGSPSKVWVSVLSGLPGTNLIESSAAPEAEVAADDVGVVAAAAAVAEFHLQDPELVERVLHLLKLI